MREVTPQALVAQIAELLRASEIHSIRTERRIGQQSPIDHLVLLSDVDKPRYAKIYRPDPGKACVGAARVAKYGQVGEEAAARVMDLARQLRDLNPVGGWPLRKPQRGSLNIASVDGLGQADFHAYPALATSFDDVAALLGDRISRIEIESRTFHTPHGELLRRDAWHAYYDIDGNQVASHHVRDLSLFVQNWLGAAGRAMQPEAEASLTMRAEQLGLKIDEFVKLIMAVKNLHFLGANCVILPPPGAA